jgi:hypothetical protein
MSSRTPALWWTARACAAGAGAIILAAGLAGVAGAQGLGRTASRYAPVTSAPAGHGTGAVNPYSPARAHSYRHGVLPTVGRLRQMRRWASGPGAAAAKKAFTLNVTYGGGLSGHGVTTGKEKVYLVFYGSQWGAAGADKGGDVTLAGDPSGEAPYLQRMFKGLGTGSERWSGVMTQYCDGVAVNAQVCPANSLHVGYPAGGSLAGVWVDERKASPAQATGLQLGSEAIAAAAHFGNKSAAANRNAQYVILSPTGTNPDGFNTPNGGFCAWHDDSGDPNLPGGPVDSALDVAFTNMPYVTDAGPNCGENFVNAGVQGVLDGASIVEGHEYAETITDQYPASGWTDSEGAENGDLCAWNPVGAVGGTNNLTLPNGTFAMQSTWGNDLNRGMGGCEFSHRVVTNNWVLNGGFETGTFASWKISGPATSIASSGAHSGKHAALAGRSTPSKGTSAVAQTFTARGTHLSFWYNVTCPDTVTQSWATATLTDNTTHTAVTVLAKTCQAHSGWKQVATSVVAGHSYTLSLMSHDDNDTTGGDGTFTMFDDVSNF